MKCFLALFLILILSFSCVESRRLRRSHHKRHKGGFTSKLYQFAIGCATELVGGVEIDKCLPDGWKNANAPEESEVDDDIVKEQSTWQKVGEVIGIAINVVCAAKDVVEQIITYFTSEAKRRLRRYMRLFAQGKITRRFKMKWSVEDFIKSASSSVANAAKSIATKSSQAYKTVKNGVTAAADWVGKEIGKINDAIKNALSAVFEKVIKFFIAIKEKLKKFFTSPFMQMVKSFVGCLQNLKEAAGNVKTLIEGFISKAADIANFPSGFIKIVVGLICAWEDLRDAITFLISGIKESDEKKKWNFYGKFLGKLIYVIGTS